MAQNNNAFNNRYYMLSFNSIKEGLKKVIEDLELDKNVFKNFDIDAAPDDNDEFYKAMVQHIVSFLAQEDFPSINSDDYPNTYAFSLFGDNFFFRTKSRMSFSWEYDKKALNEGEVKIIFFVSFKDTTNPYHRGMLNKRCQKLEELGWEKTDAATVSTKSTRKKRMNKRDNNQNQFGDNISQEAADKMKAIAAESSEEESEGPKQLNIEDKVEVADTATTTVTPTEDVGATQIPTSIEV